MYLLKKAGMGEDLLAGMIAENQAGCRAFHVEVTDVLISPLLPSQIILSG
jgi:hypothetical protein